MRHRVGAVAHEQHRRYLGKLDQQLPLLVAARKEHVVPVAVLLIRRALRTERENEVHPLLNGPSAQWLIGFSGGGKIDGKKREANIVRDFDQATRDALLVSVPEQVIERRQMLKCLPERLWKLYHYHTSFLQQSDKYSAVCLPRNMFLRLLQYSRHQKEVQLPDKVTRYLTAPCWLG